MGAVTVDSQINDETRTILQASLSLLDSGLKGKIKSDYADFISLGLFASQISNIEIAVNAFASSHEQFIAVINDNKNQWEQVEKDVQEEVKEYEDEAGNNNNNNNSNGNSNGRRNSNGNGNGNGNNGSHTHDGGQTEDVDHGVSVSTADVKSIIGKLNEITSCVLLKKLQAMNNGSITDLIINPEKSGILLALLKKILGDTTELSQARTAESDEVQKELLKKLNLDKEDTSTEDGKAAVDKKIIAKIDKAPKDDEEWNKLVYGDKTRSINVLDGEWVVAKTKTTAEDYEKYARNSGVRQDANTAEWGDSCLAFAEAHAYDMYNGTKTSGASAAGYARGGAFTDYMSDNKQEVLAKIYDEIMNGRTMVLQVNGNKAGTSRHFVTVVGFRKGVTSGSSLTEKDLLIIDSWDGKLERMDTATSRFMTSGKDCGKSYTGYRLRVFKNA